MKLTIKNSPDILDEDDRLRLPVAHLRLGRLRPTRTANNVIWLSTCDPRAVPAATGQGRRVRLLGPELHQDQGPAGRRAAERRRHASPTPSPGPRCTTRPTCSSPATTVTVIPLFQKPTQLGYKRHHHRGGRQPDAWTASPGTSRTGSTPGLDLATALAAVTCVARLEIAVLRSSSASAGRDPVVVLVATFVVFAARLRRAATRCRTSASRPGVSQETLAEPRARVPPRRVAASSSTCGWLGDFVQGDWGTSFRTERPVADMVGEAAWNSFLLVGHRGGALGGARRWCIGVVSAVRAVLGVRPRRDRRSPTSGSRCPTSSSRCSCSSCSWCGCTSSSASHVFYVQGKYCVGEEGNLVNLLQHMVLPVAALMLTSVAAWSRYQRDSMLDVLHTDYVRTARAKGVPRRADHPPPRAAQRARSRSSPSSRSTPACCSVVWWWSSGSSAGPASGCCSSTRSNGPTTRCSSRGWRSRPCSSCCATSSPTSLYGVARPAHPGERSVGDEVAAPHEHARR